MSVKDFSYSKFTRRQSQSSRNKSVFDEIKEDIVDDKTTGEFQRELIISQSVQINSDKQQEGTKSSHQNVGKQLIKKMKIEYKKRIIQMQEKKLEQKVVNLTDQEDCEMISKIINKHRPTKKEMQFVVNGLLRLEIFMKCENVLQDTVNNVHIFKEFKIETFNPLQSVFMKGDMGKKFYIVLKGELFCLITDQTAEGKISPINEGIGTPTNSSQKRQTTFSEGIQTAHRTALFNKMMRQDISPKILEVKEGISPSSNTQGKGNNTLQRQQTIQSIWINSKDSITIQEQTYLKQKYPLQKAIKVYKVGESFGEIALLTQGIRMGTMICRTEVEVISLSRDGFNRIKGAWLESELHKKICFLKKYSFFKDLSDSRLMSILHMMEILQIEKGKVLFQRTEQFNSIFFLQNGCIQLYAVLEEEDEEFSQNQEIGDCKYLMRSKIKVKEIPIITMNDGSYFGYPLKFMNMKKEQGVEKKIEIKAVAESLQATVFTIEINKFEEAMKGFNGSYNYKQDIFQKIIFQNERISNVIKLQKEMREQIKSEQKNKSSVQIISDISTNQFENNFSNQKSPNQSANIILSNSNSKFLLPDENEGLFQKSKQVSEKQQQLNQNRGIFTNTLVNDDFLKSSDQLKFSFNSDLGEKLEQLIRNKQMNLKSLNIKDSNIKAIGVSPADLIQHVKLISKSDFKNGQMVGDMKKTLISITNQGIFANISSKISKESPKSNETNNNKLTNFSPLTFNTQSSPLQNLPSQSSTATAEFNFDLFLSPDLLQCENEKTIEKQISQFDLCNIFHPLKSESESETQRSQKNKNECSQAKEIKEFLKKKNGINRQDSQERKMSSFIKSLKDQQSLNKYKNNDYLLQNSQNDKTQIMNLDSQLLIHSKRTPKKTPTQFTFLTTRSNKVKSFDSSSKISIKIKQSVNNCYLTSFNQSRQIASPPLSYLTSSLNSSPFRKSRDETYSDKDKQEFVPVGSIRPYLSIKEGVPRNYFQDCKELILGENFRDSDRNNAILNNQQNSVISNLLLSPRQSRKLSFNPLRHQQEQQIRLASIHKRIKSLQ